jgi:hypothetical protein
VRAAELEHVALGQIDFLGERLAQQAAGRSRWWSASAAPVSRNG